MKLNKNSKKNDTQKLDHQGDMELNLEVEPLAAAQLMVTARELSDVFRETLTEEQIMMFDEIIHLMQSAIPTEILNMAFPKPDIVEQLMMLME